MVPGAEGLAKSVLPAAAPAQPPQSVAEVTASSHVLDLALNYLSQDNTLPCTTGFKLLDKHLEGGLMPSGIYTIAGGTGVGKSSLVLSMARRLAFDHFKRVIYLSLEMTGQEVIERAICQSTRHNVKRLRELRNTHQLESLITPFLKTCHATKFRIEDNRHAAIDDLEVLFDEMRRVDEPLPDVIVIDHLQQQQFNEGLSRTDAISNYMADLKEFAKRYHLIVLLASQLNREGRKEKQSETYHLKQSSAIEDNSDAVLLCHRDDVSNANQNLELATEPVEFKIRIAKHRRGPLSELTLIFHPDLYEFDEPEGGWQPKVNRNDLIMVE